MAKTTDFLSNTSGKINQDYYTRQTDNGTILVHTARRRKDARRSEKQATLRCQLPNAAAVYKLFTAKKLVNAFENKESGVNDYNAFVQANYNKTAVFVPKDVSRAGGCVLANYLYSRGSIAPIRLILGQTNLLVTDLALGSLTIDANTTVAEFSNAVMANNTGWEVKDQLTFFYAEQWVDSEGVPRATMQSHRMVISRTDQTKLLNVVSALGFSTVNGYLGMSTALSEAGASWVHSREDDNGQLKVSTQRMMVVSTILATYQGDDAMRASADSYGGINTRDEYLNPNSTLAELSALATSASGAEQSSQGSQSGTGNGGTSSGNSGNTGDTGGNTGGSSTGSDTGNSGNTGNGGNTGGNTGGNSGGSETSGTPVLTISKTGSGSATVTAGGNAVNSGAELAENTEVSITVTPATGQTPTATLNGNSVELTEDSGTYTGTFTMPNANATLVINTGSAEGYGDTN